VSHANRNRASRSASKSASKSVRSDPSTYVPVTTLRFRPPTETLHLVPMIVLMKLRMGVPLRLGAVRERTEAKLLKIEPFPNGNRPRRAIWPSISSVPRSAAGVKRSLGLRPTGTGPLSQRTGPHARLVLCRRRSGAKVRAEIAKKRNFINKIGFHREETTDYTDLTDRRGRAWHSPISHPCYPCNPWFDLPLSDCGWNFWR